MHKPVAPAMDDALVEKVARSLLEQEGEQIVRDMAGHVGDEIHAVLKRHGMLMQTTGGAVSVGVLAAIQVLAETVEFARRSMDGDADDEQAIVKATVHLFLAEASTTIPDLRLAGVKEGLEMAASRFERAIQDGYQSPANPHDRCEHGHGSHDDCIACYDDALAVAIADIRSLEPRP